MEIDQPPTKQQELEYLNLHAQLACTQKIEYYGSNTPKILIISQGNWIPKTWIEHLRVPSTELGIIRIENYKSKLTKITESYLLNYLFILKPEMIITIGAIPAKYFMPNIDIKKQKGMLYEKEEKFQMFKFCPLMSPGWYKMQKWVSEWKQFERLKTYLMNVYEYGV